VLIRPSSWLKRLYFSGEGEGRRGERERKGTEGALPLLQIPECVPGNY